MSTKQFTIPVFIPMEACPFRCIFCDQKKISGQIKIPTLDEVAITIQTHLDTIPRNSEVQVGFFGGTFTGLSPEIQAGYLGAVQPFIKSGSIQSIRLSTRPDFITQEILNLLKSYHVETIELGAQSMDDEVLRKSGRGHRAEKTVEASKMIRENGFRLGLQMMIGLPGDSPEKSMMAAQKFVELGALDVRIYPALVIKDTPMEKLFRTGKYKPLSLDEAVKQTAVILPVFEKTGINVIRVGLHPSDGLMDKSDLVSGPFHVSFRELVLTKLWRDQLIKIPKNNQKDLTVFIPPGEVNYAVGYEASNKKMLLNNFRRVRFRTNPELGNRNYYVDYC